MSNEERYPAIVVEVVDDYQVVINKGSEDGIEEGQRFLIYELSEEKIKDPETGENLGKLEYVKGKGKVIHVQEKMSTIESIEEDDSTARTIEKTNPLGIKRKEKIHTTPEIKPFQNPKIKDKAKPI